MAWCPDVFADKPHPRFDTKTLSKKVRLIRRCLRYFYLFCLGDFVTSMGQREIRSASRKVGRDATLPSVPKVKILTLHVDENKKLM